MEKAKRANEREWPRNAQRTGRMKLERGREVPRKRTEGQPKGMQRAAREEAPPHRRIREGGGGVVCPSFLGRRGGEPTANIPEQAKASIHGRHKKQGRAVRPGPAASRPEARPARRTAAMHADIDFTNGLANTSSSLSLWTASGQPKVRSHPWRKPAGAAAGSWPSSNRRGRSCSLSQSVSPVATPLRLRGWGESQPRSFRGQSRVAETRDSSFDKRGETSAMARLEGREFANVTACHLTWSSLGIFLRLLVTASLSTGLSSLLVI